MGKEIERKYLVVDSSFKQMSTKSIEIVQGYISAEADSTVRVRIAGQRAFLTIKSRNVGMVRGEWEYEIPVEDARDLLVTFAKGKCLEKTRYYVPQDNLLWEIDEYHGPLAGLVVAELELPDVAATQGELPPYIGEEVTGDPRYYNSQLIKTMEIPE